MATAVTGEKFATGAAVRYWQPLVHSWDCASKQKDLKGSEMDAVFW